MSRVVLDIKRTVDDTVRLPFQGLAEASLPQGFQLSLVLCGDTLAQKMNATYRKKTYRPNVLSFPLSKSEGEIFLNVRKAEREAHALGTTLNKRLALLFVHGCFHLAGFDHSDRMEALEIQVLKKFKLA